MADKRAKDLNELLVSEIQALLVTLSIPVDDGSFSEAKKLLLSSLLNSSIIAGNTNNYQAITQKAFWDSVATEDNRGIVKQAIEEEITSKAGSNVLTAEDQTTMQAQWKKDWFEGDSVPKVYEADNLASPGALSCNVNFKKESLAASSPFVIGPTLPSNHRYRAVRFDYVVWTPSSSTVPGTGSGTLVYTGAQQTYILFDLGGIQLTLRLSGDGTELSIVSGSGPLDWHGSFRINSVTDSF